MIQMIACLSSVYDCFHVEYKFIEWFSVELYNTFNQSESAVRVYSKFYGSYIPQA